MERFIQEIPAPSQNPGIKQQFDVVIIGGGMSGLCAAIASAREGAKTVLVQDRPVFGGNASSEMRMHISGASCHWGKKNASETGILMELMLENKYLNDNYNYSIWDAVLWGAAKKEKNLTIYLNTTMETVHSDGKEIQWVDCYQMTTEKRFAIEGKIYMDCTGNGTLGYFAGAEYAIGREGNKIYNEKDAPDECDGETMGNTLYYVAEDKGRPIKFIKPDWAMTLDESDFVGRTHFNAVTYHDDEKVIYLPYDVDYHDYPDKLLEKYDVKSGFWWIELGGNWNDVIGQAEDIRWELYRLIYGVWDHIKNQPHKYINEKGEEAEMSHGAENYDLVWVGNMPGTRESRRLMGNYILTADDILANCRHDDAVAYGGWPMDEHVAGGFEAKGINPSIVRNVDGLYTIPYGCFCSKTISNLMMAGRNISASKLAMGSTRVMATCAIGGEAAGTAAALAVKHGVSPKEYGEQYMDELQQTLLRNDCYIPGKRNTDPADHALKATVTATSEKAGYEAVKVISGIARTEEDGDTNLWVSEGIGDGQTLTLSWDAPVEMKQVRLTLDPDLSDERCISVSTAFIEKEPIGVAVQLLKDYTVTAYCGGEAVWSQKVEGNYQRLNILDLPEAVKADKVEITVHATNGDPDARIFEVRVY